MKTLILWLDACRFDYISQMPFLSSLTRKGNFGYLKPVLGFNSVLASFMTGLYPNRHGQFTAYCLDSRRDKIGRDKILKILPNFIAPYYFNLKRYFQGKDFPVPFVNYKYSKNFNVAQEIFYHHRNLSKARNFLDILDDNKLGFIFYNWPFIYKNKGKTKLQFSLENNDKNRVKKFINLIKNNDFDVYFLHLWDLDKYGHQFGPKSSQVVRKLKQEDELVRKIFKKFSWTKDNIIIWSDHGMLPVNKTVNIIDKLPISSKYKFFIDSTVARFWFDNSQIKSKIFDILDSFSSFGHILSLGEKNKFKINFSNNKFGEEIFLANSGVLILPNFFQDKPIKGMHGYDLSDKNEWGIVISNCFPVNNLEVVDLLPNILRTLNIKDTKL